MKSTIFHRYWSSIGILLCLCSFCLANNATTISSYAASSTNQTSETASSTVQTSTSTSSTTPTSTTASSTNQTSKTASSTVQTSTSTSSTTPSSTTISSTTQGSATVRNLTALVRRQNSSSNCPNYGAIPTIITKFSNHLISIIGGEDNLFFSPFCISVALAMVYLGTRGETAKSFEEGLGYDKVGNRSELPEIIHELFQDTLNSLESTESAYILEVANGLFIQEGFRVSPMYILDLQEFYTAKLYALDFRSEGEIATSEINDWVSNHTAGKISSIFNEPLDPMTILLLVNAIYFRGFWKYPFNERSTRPQNFYSKNDTFTSVPFMDYTKTVFTFRDDSINYTFLEMDYRGDDVSMVFALPYDRNQFPDLEITATLMCKVRSNLRPDRVHVMIPKFKLAYERELSNDLFHLGLGDLFSETRANLTGIRYQNDLFVSGIIHKAVIEVNEKGSEASAATGVSFNARSGHSRPQQFKADHPFLFCILDKRSGTILFLGRVVDL